MLLVDHWGLESRYRVQELMLDLVVYEEERPTLAEDDFLRSVFAVLCGTSVSLWRAVFLINHRERNWVNITSHAVGALRSIVNTNGLPFSAELENANYMAGYYMYSAKFRLARIVDKCAEYPHATDFRVLASASCYRTLLLPGSTTNGCLRTTWALAFECLELACQALYRYDETGGVQPPLDL